MRIGVIADTHIPQNASEIPEKIIKDFKNVDMIIHAGDLGDASVLEELNKACKNVKAVWGNMDPPELKSKLPEKQIFKAGDYKIGLMHGFGPPNGIVNCLSCAFKDDKVDIIIFGHSHSGLNKKVGNILFFNPGTATDKVFAEYNSYGIIEINGGIKARIIKL